MHTHRMDEKRSFMRLVKRNGARDVKFASAFSLGAFMPGPHARHVLVHARGAVIECSTYESVKFSIRARARSLYNPGSWLFLPHSTLALRRLVVSLAWFR